jgi:hypothetical protein
MTRPSAVAATVVAVAVAWLAAGDAIQVCDWHRLRATVRRPRPSGVQ